MSISIKRTPTQITIASPYSPDLPARARQLSGRWDRANGVWVFPLAAEPQVEGLYRDIYGSWDLPTETVTLICTVQPGGAGEHNDGLSLHGRVIARASGRDSGARTAEGVVVLEGGFSSGGSAKNWRTCAGGGTRFRLLDVPREKANAMVTDPRWCSKIEIEAASQPIAPNREALIAERTILAARMAEIDALLHQD